MTGLTTPPASTLPPRQAKFALPKRRRSALKVSTPGSAAPSLPTPTRHTPQFASMSAGSTSVVARSHDGTAAMLFSRTEIRLPRAAPLAVRAFGGSGGYGSNSSTCSTGSMSSRPSSVSSTRDIGDGGSDLSSGGKMLPRFSPSFASVREKELIRRSSWCLETPAVESCSSPPRLAALGANNHARHASGAGRLESSASTLKRTVGAAEGAHTATTTATAATKAAAGVPVMEQGRDQKNLVASAKRSAVCKKGSTSTTSISSTTKSVEGEQAKNVKHKLLAKAPSQRHLPIPLLKKPVVGEADYLADYGQGATAGLKKGKDVCPEKVGTTTAAASTKRKAWSRRPRGGGHTGMSVAEFADKVAALAADVAGVFGMVSRKAASSPPPPPGATSCRAHEVE